jgi:hypothetical protein
MTTKQGQKTVGILVFDEVAVLDFCGPFEVFSLARLLWSLRGVLASPTSGGD